MKITRIYTIFFIAIVAITSNAWAEPPPGMEGGPPSREEMLERFDTDKDGELSEEEREAMFKEMEKFMGGGPGGRPGGFRGGPGGRGMRFQDQKLVEKFDADNDGILNDEERQAAREYIQNERGTEGSSRATEKEEAIVDPDQVKHYPDAELYDESIMRTLFLEFPDEDWFAEMADFYKTDVEIPADLTVDGVTYKSVGVSFRGNSSYNMTRNSDKKPLNISIDYADPKQKLYGYKTLNLLNGNSDPSFIREVLYSKICREYIPAPKTNFVKLVINGENWGVYVNVQQYNKDLIQDWFGNRGGVRWKISPGGGRGRDGGGALNWVGADVESYKKSYQLKTGSAPDTCWENLVDLCDKLNNTPDDQLEAVLSPILNIDTVLWHIALENIFIDEGYVSRGADYYLYMSADGRFQTMPYDNNEVFRFAGGGPDMWPTSGSEISPVAQDDNERLPLISRLLSAPNLRARYIAHFRTIMDEWLNWDNISPIISEYQSVIDAEVKADNKKLYTYEAFINSPTEDFKGGEGFGGPPGGGPSGFGRGGFGRRGGGDRQRRGDGENRGGRPGRGGGPGHGATPSFKRFVIERKEFLSSHSEIDKPVPVIQSVTQPDELTPVATKSTLIGATIIGDVKPDAVILYYAKNANVPFETVIMADDGNGIYSAEIPPMPAGKKVSYYVEARAVETAGTTVFSPAKAELGALSYKIKAPVADGSPVVINEIMAINTTSLADPQDQYDDWIELHNASDEEIDLSGMYLTDNKKNPRKWAFPENTIIAANGYLIVWADGDKKAESGLHANFKLSKNGETVMLIDRDDRGNTILDSIEFGEQKEDVAVGRFPDGTGYFEKLSMTPGSKNRLQY